MCSKKYSINRIIELLTDLFQEFPGVGKKTALRFAYFMVSKNKKFYERFIDGLTLVKENILECSICHNISETDPCPICNNENRDDSVLCIVEDINGINAIERMGRFMGKYHVLQGVISPLAGVHPDDLTIKDLIKRVNNSDSIKELIIATSPTTEGEVTANFIKKHFTDKDIKITRIAYGVPVGSNLDYIDEVTLSKALEGRQEF